MFKCWAAYTEIGNDAILLLIIYIYINNIQRYLFFFLKGEVLRGITIFPVAIKNVINQDRSY